MEVPRALVVIMSTWRGAGSLGASLSFALIFCAAGELVTAAVAWL